MTGILFRRTLLVGLLAVTALGCGKSKDKMTVTPDEVDQDSPVTLTDDERAKFTAPTDSLLSGDQVTSYLKASLLQFDLIRKQSATWHQKAAEIEARQKEGGTLGGLRNAMEAGRLMMNFADVIGGSYIRASRTLGYNPAEMDWVRERMAEVGGYAAVTKPMMAAMKANQSQMQASIDDLRKQMAAAKAAGEEQVYSDEDIERMAANAQSASSEMATGTTPAMLANLEVLHKTKPAGTDAMWGTVGIAGGAMGLMALGGLADPADTSATRKLTEFRRVYEDALANRVSPGMADGVPGDSATAVK